VAPRGFDLTLDNRTQRIDITWHAARAFMKSIDNGITSAFLILQANILFRSSQASNATISKFAYISKLPEV
jgi:hypothetical protein